MQVIETAMSRRPERVPSPTIMSAHSKADLPWLLVSGLPDATWD